MLKTRTPSLNQPTRVSPTAVAMKRIAEQQAAAAHRRAVVLGYPEKIALAFALAAALVFANLAPHLSR